MSVKGHPHTFRGPLPRVGQGQVDGEALVAPIVQSTALCRGDVGSTAEHQYSRVSNPMVAALEEATRPHSVGRW